MAGEDASHLATARGRDIRGAMFMLLNAACLVAGVALIRVLGRDLPEPVIVLFRFLFALAFFAPSILRGGGELLATRRPGAHALRAACGYAGFVAFVYAAQRMPLADVMALGFTQPLWAAAIGMLAFGERFSAARALALLAGFAGAMLVLRPGFAHAPLLPALAALANALLTCIAMMTVKRLSATEPAGRIAALFLLVGTLLSAPGAWVAWTTPAPAALPWLVVLGALAWIGQVSLSRGYALGRFSTMAAMDFARLPAALAIGWIAFAEAPDGLAVAGMALIGVASTAIVLWRSAPGRANEDDAGATRRGS
ncbi:MAG: DMT family transporter [Alphaproteobacteria bacterium]|jgi:drug/metabolite transporter (DMT)-like permease